MRRAVIITAVVAALAFTAGSCDLFGALTPAEISAALGVAAHEVAGYGLGSVHTARSGVSPRAFADSILLTGSVGGSVTFTFDYGDGGAIGTFTFDGYAFELESGDQYVIDGSIDATIGYSSPLSATFSGVLEIDKNGDGLRAYEIDVELTIDGEVDWETGVVTLTVGVTGTIDGEDASGSYPVVYSGAVPL